MAKATKVPQEAKAVANYPKQAVVIIHGMGEQRPMDTIKSFVRSVWEYDRKIINDKFPNPAEVWSKPDLRTGSLELRRITTRPAVSTKTFKQGVRTDFYELYWADLSAGATWSQVRNWFAYLLLRNPRSVPRPVRGAWLWLWALAAIVVLVAIGTASPVSAYLRLLPWPLNYAPLALALFSFVIATVMSAFIVHYFGCVVRYTRATPENIAARKNIRERGLVLLTNLHKAEYERIVIVGHSLGSILAYDLVSYFWASRLDSHTVTEGSKEFENLVRLERAAAALAKSPNDKNFAKEYRRLQRMFGESLRKRKRPSERKPIDRRWLITDLITLGSPLTHAGFLLAKAEKELKSRKEEREFPICPPVRELLDKDVLAKARKAKLPLEKKERKLLCFPLETKRWQLHHAAPFAAVRWTNIYDPPYRIFWGDVVSGPLAPVFGPAIVDVNLRTASPRSKSRWFTHLDYWRQDAPGKPPIPVRKLRWAIDLGGQRFRIKLGP